MKTLTAAAWQYLSGFTRNPDMARALMREMQSGAIVSMDGEPVLEEAAPDRATQQMQLDTHGGTA
jgi:hypothetical protein